MPGTKKSLQSTTGCYGSLRPLSWACRNMSSTKWSKRASLSVKSQGIYRLKESEPLGNPDLVQISLRVPRAVICLISALYFHELTTQIPHEVYIALPREVKTPKIQYPPIKAFHFSPESYQAGVVEHKLDGVRVKIYDREKTIADCFKFRSRIGLNIALEALKDYLSTPGIDIQLLVKYARVNRVENSHAALSGVTGMKEPRTNLAASIQARLQIKAEAQGKPSRNCSSIMEWSRFLYRFRNRNTWTSSF